MMDRNGNLIFVAEALARIQSSTSSETQLATLKQLKNSLVGHDNRKELAVEHGLLDCIVFLLGAATKSAGKNRQRDVNGAQPRAEARCEEVRLQCVLIIATLASGGAPFIPPLVAAGIPEALLELLHIDASARLVTSALRALRSIATAWADTHDDLNTPLRDNFPNIAQGSPNIFMLEVLRNDSNSGMGEQHLRLVADLISSAAAFESVKTTLIESQVLDALAALVASFAIHHGLVESPAERFQFPPSPSKRNLPNVLAAVSRIISGSVYRAQCFIHSPALLSLFSVSRVTDSRNKFGARQGSKVYGQPQLPLLHIPAYATTTYNGVSRAFPALASLHTDNRRALAGIESIQQGVDPDHASAICSFLIILARSLPDADRLTALKLLALVNNAVDVDVIGLGWRTETMQKAFERNKQLALLAVPLLVQAIQRASDSKLCNSALSAGQAMKLRAKEDALVVLALLISEKQELQTAAVDAQAIKYMCPILKKSFDAIPVSKPMWSSKTYDVDSESLPASRRLGPSGLPIEILHAMRCRRNALEAVAALAAKDDLHRKAIVDAGIVPCIIDSLKPFPADYLQMLHKGQVRISPKDGNTTEVILSACRAARSMSRSVAALRTSLIDAGLGKPILPLLVHPDLEVQIGATDVCANLVLDFSVLREDFMKEPTTVKVLVEHARSNSPALRLPSLWALKHLVLSAPVEVKLNVLEEIGAGWLVGAIQGSQSDVASTSLSGGVTVGLSTPNAAGEQVDLLNPSTMDIDEAVNERHIADDGDGEFMYDEASSTHYQASQLRSTLELPTDAFDARKYLYTMREMETNPVLRARRDEVAVQEQALDFVRNLLSGEDCAVMFEHLMTQIGSTKIFDLLTAKLQPLPIPCGRTGPGRQVYHPTELVLSTVHLVLHIASSGPKHKQLLIAQKPLLQALVPHFMHSDRRVRVICVYAVNSLTWVENEQERSDSRLRARELRIMGIEVAVRRLQNDPDLDVRERVKTALRQLESL